MKKPELPPEPGSYLQHALDVLAVTTLVTIPVAIACTIAHYARKAVGR